MPASIWKPDSEPSGEMSSAETGRSQAEPSLSGFW